MRWFPPVLLVVSLALASGCLIVNRGDDDDGSPTPTATDTPSPTPAPHVIYVHPDGDDANDGTMGAPLASLQVAVAAVESQFGSGQVRVAEGTYPVDGSDALTRVVLRGGVSLYGGFVTDFSERDPDAYMTTIEDTATSGDPTTPLEIVGSDVGSDTVVDGFTILGGGGTDSVGTLVRDGARPLLRNNTIDGGVSDQPFAVWVQNGAAPTLVANDIDGGTSTQGTSVGVLVSNSHATLVGNTIYGGTDGGGSRGVSITGSATLIGNDIHGGLSGQPYGVQGKPTSLVNNVIYGGDATGAGTSYGAQLIATGVIRNNTFVAGLTNGASIGLQMLTGASSSDLENNLIVTRPGPSERRCLDLQAAVGGSLHNNLLFDCPDALVNDGANTDLTDIADVNMLGGDVGGNVSADPVLEDVANGDYHLTDGSPTSATEGGLDLSEVVPTDRDGLARTDPLSIGAYELDQPAVGNGNTAP